MNWCYVQLRYRSWKQLPGIEPMIFCWKIMPQHIHSTMVPTRWPLTIWTDTLDGMLPCTNITILSETEQGKANANMKWSSFSNSSMNNSLLLCRTVWHACFGSIIWQKMSKIRRYINDIHFKERVLEHFPDFTKEKWIWDRVLLVYWPSETVL